MGTRESEGRKEGRKEGERGKAENMGVFVSAVGLFVSLTRCFYMFSSSSGVSCWSALLL